MNKQLKNYLQKTIVTLDFVILNLAFLISKIIFEGRMPTYSGSHYLQFWAVLNVSWVMLCLICTTYADNHILNFEYFTKRSVQVFLLWIIAMLFYLFFTRQFELSRFFMLFLIGVFGVGLLVNRFLYLGLSNYMKKRNHLANKVLIIGYNETAKKLENYFEEEGFNLHLLGFIEDEKKCT